MTYLGALLVGIFAAEILLRFPFLSTANSLLLRSKKAGSVIVSRKISDHWKEKVILKYSGQIAYSTIRLGIIILIFSLIVGVLIYGFEQLCSPGFFEFIISPIGLVVTTICSVLYMIMRSRLVTK